jgi:hypothetical protein
MWITFQTGADLKENRALKNPNLALRNILGAVLDAMRV